ncbi:MAG: chorismate mutase [Alphaproteobacteria bacterium]
MKILEPYRARIDELDQKILELLAQRYEVIEEVGHLKAREGIASTLPGRVDEVRENAARMAAEKNLDEDFIRTLYAQLIDHSCALEEQIIQETRARKKA